MFVNMRAKRKSCPAPTKGPIELGLGAPITEPKPGQAVSVFISSVGMGGHIGTGWRYLLVIAVGPRTRRVTLFHVSTLTTLRLSEKEFLDLRPRTYGASFTTLRDILARNVETAKRHSMQFSQACADLTMQILQGEPVPCTLRQ